MQHENLAVLNGEFEILHILEMRLKGVSDPLQLDQRFGQMFFQIRDRFRCANAGDDIFALGVDEKLAVEHFLAGGRIPGERDARTGVEAGVTEDHCLHVHRRAPFLGNVVFPAIDDGAIVHPRAEHGADRSVELLPGIVGKLFAGPLFHQLFETCDQLFQIAHAQFGIVDILLMALVFELVDHRLERLVIFLGALLHAHDHITIHLDKAPITIPRETFVVCRFRQHRYGFVVHAEIENCIHHSRHRIPCARSHRYQQRHRFGVAEGRAHDPFHPANPFFHL